MELILDKSKTQKLPYQPQYLCGRQDSFSHSKIQDSLIQNRVPIAVDNCIQFHAILTIRTIGRIGKSEIRQIRHIKHRIHRIAVNLIHS